MKFIYSLLMLALFSGFAMAQTLPGPTVIDKTVWQCEPTRCQIECFNNQGVRVLYDSAENSIRSILFSNGNTIFNVEDGARGRRTIFLGRENLSCKMSNIR